MKYIKQSLRSKPNIKDIKEKILRAEAAIYNESISYMNYTFNRQYPWKLDYTNSYVYVIGQMIYNHQKLIRLKTVLAVLEGKNVLTSRSKKYTQKNDII